MFFSFFRFLHREEVWNKQRSDYGKKYIQPLNDMFVRNDIVKKHNVVQLYDSQPASSNSKMKNNSRFPRKKKLKRPIYANLHNIN